ncbi:MAG: SIS domain-containing protein [Jaaginema sp. PMC 1079.18]|nr:SIS domain-containing protein [Jaaginema sp. PMC 1080.18]MEC4853794.1 SIS domain-containing protein [Jaaginema sp. PMC 1079.18]MEC4869069.1 SIS domain-containing protein [Jaaginema sp. PMC 1078.18]
MKNYIQSYRAKLHQVLESDAMDLIPELGFALLSAWQERRGVYLCGNGGSAGNAIHLANDLIYGAGMKVGGGVRVEALSANSAVLTCLANDLGYEQVYAQQLRVKANPGDILVALSGSGNSPNIVSALQVGNQIGMKTFAILGFSGGLCKELAQVPLHFPINDMQIAEDIQLIIGHICMQWLCENLGNLKNSQNNGNLIQRSIA